MRAEGSTMAGGPRTGDVAVGNIRFELREREPRPSPTRIRDPHLRENPAPIAPPQKRQRDRPQHHNYDRRAAQPSTTPAHVVERMIELYEQGSTAAQVAEQVGMSRPTVLRYLKEEGVKMRGARKNVPIEEIVEKYEGGASLRDIASSLGMSNTTVRKRLLDAGVEVRSQGAWRAMRREASAVGTQKEDG